MLGRMLRSFPLMLALVPAGLLAPARADPSALTQGNGLALSGDKPGEAKLAEAKLADIKLAGVWTLSLDNGTSCRVMLRPQRTDLGDYFLGMPAACRHAMPKIETVGRWAQPDAAHVMLADPAGKPVLALAARPDGSFSASAREGTYVMRPVASATSRSIGFDAVDTRSVTGFATVTPIATKAVTPARSMPEAAEDLAGRYAVMREKRDTGCMVTLDDKSRVKGGSVRAQLAPGCRDQGIVIFDPSAWQVVKGQLVLTARAGHKTVLEKKQEGLWEKDAKEGGKPLGLKKL